MCFTLTFLSFSILTNGTYTQFWKQADSQVFQEEYFEIPPSRENFELGELLGSGGYGKVYRAREKFLDYNFALKVKSD